MRSHRGYGERIEPLQASSFARANASAIAPSRPGEPFVLTLRERAKAIQKIGFVPDIHLSDMAAVVDEPSLLADAIAPLLPCEISQKQELLETGDVITRLQKLLALLQTGKQAA